jgi:eukaryotic-like serine/threonine-protein kinase
MSAVPDALREALANRYRLERELGAGGMATVYLATDLRHDRPVAVKVLRADHAVALGAERFHREIRVLARLRHPFILPLHDSGEAAGAFYFVMPYIDGESLRARLAREGSLPLADALDIVGQVADALEHAHREGVVHRDVKPENILISRHGHALLADFGIARGAAEPGAEAMTQVGITLGTAAYMSPEQALGQPDLDGRSDVYALGCVTYEMLAGAPPFEGLNAMAVIAKHLTAPAPTLAVARPAVPAAVASAVARALEKEPADRFATTTDFARALGGRETTTALVAASHTGARLSLAVLPIARIGGGEDDEFFAEGLTEELTNALARLEGLRVVSRGAAFSLRGRDVSAAEVGARLGVEFVLSGSVRRSGSRMRLTAQLLRAADDSVLWSEKYERTLDDVFAVQDDVTMRIVDTIASSLQLGHLRGQVPVAQTRNIAAYDFYLLGRHHWYERTEAGMRRALALFEQAVEADPSYAPAWAGIADASMLLASWQFARPEEMYPRAAQAVQRALALDESLADAHASLGFVKLNWEWDWEGAQRELQRAIELNPSHETAHRWLSAFLAAIGRYPEALPIAERALTLDPVSVLPTMNLGIVHYLAGRYDEGAARFAAVLERDPGFVRGYAFLAAALAYQGRFAESDATMERAEAISVIPMVRVSRVLALAVSGREAEARALYDSLAPSNLPHFYRAGVHAELGEVDAAVDELERAVDAREDWMYSITTQPFFRALRQHPRFERLKARLQLQGVTREA